MVIGKNEMGSIIDNREKTMLQTLKNALQNCESVDILTAFFYFSGFDALADELKDKKIRILVGKTIDPNLVSELSQNLNQGINKSKISKMMNISRNTLYRFINEKVNI